jgi:hypothetical protein
MTSIRPDNAADSRFLSLECKEHKVVFDGAENALGPSVRPGSLHHFIVSPFRS